MTIASDVRDAVDLILAQWARERPDLDCSPMGIIGRISQLQREVHLAQRATFARHGLDAPAFDVLAALRRAGAPYQLTPTALMRTALVTSGAITQRLDRLEEKGLITRERSEADGRAVVVTLTDAGRAALDAALPDHLETERQLLAGLSDDDRTQLADLLRRFLVSLGRLPQEPCRAVGTALCAVSQGGCKPDLPGAERVGYRTRVHLLLLVACRHLDHGRLSSTLCPGA